MTNKEEAKKLLLGGLESSLADQTEILFISSSTGLSRFANSVIHQSTNREDDYIQVRCVIGKKIGIASTNQLPDLKETVKKAYEAAQIASESSDFVSLPKEGSVEAPDENFDEKTANFGPIERADYISNVIKEAKEYKAAGMFETGGSMMAIANSNGIFSYQKQTEAEINTIFFNDSESSYAYDSSSKVDSVDPKSIGEEAYKIAKQSKKPINLEPGQYTVILKPAAVAEMLSLLAYSGLGALAYQEKRSFMNNNIDKQIAGKSITLVDNARSSDSLGWFFDYEGVRRQKVEMIKNGVAKDVVYDSFTANRSGNKNTGHALPATSTYGPMPFDIVLSPGESTLDDLIGSTKKGVLINRFHYTNLENPLETIFTGMTRDGTFLIENGKVSKAVTNMRFTQNILQALLKVDGITKESRLTPGFGGYYLVPSIKLQKFNFSSITTTD